MSRTLRDRLHSSQPKKGALTMIEAIDDLIATLKLTPVRDTIAEAQRTGDQLETVKAELAATQAQIAKTKDQLAQAQLGPSEAQFRERRDLDEAIFRSRRELAELQLQIPKSEAALAQATAKADDALARHIAMENSIASFRKSVGCG